MNELEKIILSGVFNPKIIALLQPQTVGVACAQALCSKLDVEEVDEEFESNFIKFMKNPLFKQVFSPESQKYLVKSEFFLYRERARVCIGTFEKEAKNDFYNIFLDDQSESIFWREFSKENSEFKKEFVVRKISKIVENVRSFESGKKYLDLVPEYTNKLDRGGSPFYFNLINSGSDWQKNLMLIVSNPAFDLKMRNKKGQNVLELVMSQMSREFKLNNVKKMISHPDLKNSRTLMFKFSYNEKEFKERWLIEKDLYPTFVQQMILHHYMVDKQYESAATYLSVLETQTKLPLSVSSEFNYCNRNNLRLLGLYEENGLSLINKHILSEVEAAALFYSVKSKIEIDNEKVQFINEVIEKRPELVNLASIGTYPSLEQRAKLKGPIYRREKVFELLKKIGNCRKNRYYPEFVISQAGTRKFKNLPLSLKASLLKSRSLGDLAQEILGKNTGFAQNLVHTKMFNTHKWNVPLMYWSQVLTRAGFNYDLVTSLSEASELIPPSEDENIVVFFNALKTYVSETKIISWIKNRNFPGGKSGSLCNYFTTDPLDSLVRFYQHGISVEEIGEQLQEAKNMHQLHDTFSFLAEEYIEQGDCDLEQDDVSVLDGQKVLDLTIRVPERNLELIKIGSILRICVGDGGYGEQILDGEAFVVTLNNKENKPVYCIEIDAFFNLVQCKGHSNRNMPRDYEKELIEVMKKLGLEAKGDGDGDGDDW